MPETAISSHRKEIGYIVREAGIRLSMPLLAHSRPSGS
jgi:hypothetical protein